MIFGSEECQYINMYVWLTSNISIYPMQFLFASDFFCILYIFILISFPEKLSLDRLE